MTRIMKRLINVGFASLGLVLLAPIFLFLAVAIYLVDGRPLISPEKWTDREGRLISLLAFRKNRVRLDPHLNQVVLPWIGEFLQKSGFDKLPRLWNILRGDCDLDAVWF